MNDPDDELRNVALAVIAGVVAMVLAGVIGLAAAKVLGGHGASAPATADAATPFGPVERLYFQPGSDALPIEAHDVLARVADVARATGNAMVLISGFHDAAATQADGEQLTVRRGLAVMHALEANGVPPDRVVMSTPEPVAKGEDPKQAQRIEVRLE